MDTNDFFQEIEHIPVTWRQHQLHIPVFFQDIMYMFVSFLAPIQKIFSALPSKRMKPYRLTPWHTTIAIFAYQYRKCDIGAYNELAISVPVTIDEQTPIFTGTLRKIPKYPMAYTFHMPLTAEFARSVGVEIAGYNKFLAVIDFIEEDNWLTCKLSANNQSVLSLRGRKLPLKRYPRYVGCPITLLRGNILRSELLYSERDMGESRREEDVKLELGEHPIADELRNFKLGKMLGYGYCPQAQAILTAPMESYLI